MLEDRLEHKTYRKSPGRQYGYEYDPLQSNSGGSQHGSTASRSGTLLSQRPDPRRTRQLLRQSIIASRRLDDETLEEVESELRESTMAVDRSRPTRRIHHSSSLEEVRPARGRMSRTRFIPTTREFLDDEVVQEAWPHQERERYVDPDLGIDEDVDEDLEQGGYDYAVPPRAHGDHADVPLPPARTSDPSRSRRATTRLLPEEPLDEEEVDEDYVYGEDEELPPGLHTVKKPSSSRRNLLIGAGVLVAGGVGVGLLASQANPKTSVPQAINNTAKQMQDAANKAADDARRQLLAELDAIDGFTLQGAAEAARLTRVAYDVFVTPIINTSATIAGDVLTGMLSAFKVARGWLASINQDNVTLAAIQKVLESWVQQVQDLPKHLNAIVDTDLDGAVSYLRVLQQKIAAEKQALEHPSTPGPSPAPKKP